jgi:hypothetical protein
MQKRIAAAIFFAAVAVAALGPIRSYDAFWHFAAGQWITSHHALPVTDPLTVASAKIPWIDGEWLWQVVAHGVVTAAGLTGVSWFVALLVAATFTIAFAAREGDPGISLALAAVAFAGASDRLGVRPLTAASLLVVVAIALLGRKRDLTTRDTLLYVVITVVWINTHPSALLAPLLAISNVRRWRVALASAVALLLNPYGWHALVEPFRLSALVNSGEFVNAEWQMSSAAIFPLLYAAIVIGVVWFLVAPEKRTHVWRFVLFAGFAFLAVRYVRNQCFFFAALPLLLPPLPRVPRNVSAGFAIAAIVPIAWVLQAQDHSPGVDDERFPVRAVARLAAAKLPGNIYNVDQFGGYLEFTFPGQRRVLTDGRNELFRTFIAEDAAARRDSRAWQAMLEKYHVALAVEEYSSEKLEVLDVESGERRTLPASLVRYRRRDWALIAFDDAAMIFARRAAFPPEQLAPLEFHLLVPDEPAIGYATPQIRAYALQEVERAKREIGDIRIVQELERGAAGQ